MSAMMRARPEISFTTGDSALCLTELLLELKPEQTPGPLTVMLYSGAPAAVPRRVAKLGVISTDELPQPEGAAIEIPLAASVMLQPRTRYWIELNGPQGQPAPPGPACPSAKDAQHGARHLAPQGGRLDVANLHRVAGWARHPAAAETPASVELLDNGTLIGTVTADVFRADLEKAGIGDGHHGFGLDIPEGLSPLIRHVIQARWAVDGNELPGSPRIIEPAASGPVQTSPALASHGNLDEASRASVTGWARDPEMPDIPVVLRIYANDMPIGRVTADQVRLDLVRAGLGAGRHGFAFAILAGSLSLTRQIISVRREHDGVELLGSPVVLQALDPLADDVPPAGTVAPPDPVAAGRVMSLAAARAERWGELRTAETGPAGPRALVIDERMPAALQDAASVAVLSHIRALQRLGFTVSFAATQKAAANQAVSDELAAAGVQHLATSTCPTVEDVIRQHAGRFDVAYLYRAAAASRFLALARSCNPKARILYSVGELHHLRLQRQAVIEERPALLAASSRMRIAELGAAVAADAVITHSAGEAALLLLGAPQMQVHSVPWAVPARVPSVPFAARSGVAFIGPYGYAPNEDAACWLVEVVMPLVWQANPAIDCVLAGTEMTARVRGLAQQRVLPLEAVADLFDRVRLTVAPLRYGAGLAGAVVQSLAAGTPCVMSNVAAEGLQPAPALQSLIAGNAAPDLAAQIVRLHKDEAANAALSQAGLSYVRETCSEQRVMETLGTAIGGTGQDGDQVARAG